MARTANALSIAQNVAASVGFDVPTSLKDTGDTNAGLLLALINRSCETLSTKRGPFGQCWPELVREHVLLTAADTEWYRCR